MANFASKIYKTSRKKVTTFKKIQSFKNKNLSHVKNVIIGNKFHRTRFVAPNMAQNKQKDNLKFPIMNNGCSKMFFS